MPRKRYIQQKSGITQSTISTGNCVKWQCSIWLECLLALFTFPLQHQPEPRTPSDTVSVQYWSSICILLCSLDSTYTSHRSPFNQENTHKKNQVLHRCSRLVYKWNLEQTCLPWRLKELETKQAQGAPRSSDMHNDNIQLHLNIHYERNFEPETELAVEQLTKPINNEQ